MMVYRIKRFSNIQIIEIPPDLIQWVESEIFRCYDSFDSAHSRNHAQEVIQNGFQYSNEYLRLHPKEFLDPKIIYCSCALHDIGLLKGRENHEITSGKLIRTKYYHTLRQWFSKEEIEIIAQACEDHRASLQGKTQKYLWLYPQ